MIRVFKDTDLTDRNSFHVAQRADRLIEFDTIADLHEVFATFAPRNWRVLAGGNNTLFTEPYHGDLLTPCGKRIEELRREGDTVYVRAEAGVEWDDMVEWCVERGLWGVENLSLIPGKVGAAPVQNIGAYGAEAKDTIANVEMFCPESMNSLILAPEHCSFGYRESIFKHSLKGRVIITSVEFRLSLTPAPHLGYGDVEREVEQRGGATLRNIRNAICSIRRRKLPDTAVTGNAGSFFKNPVVDTAVAERLRTQYPDMPLYPAHDDASKAKLAAGWLIDQAGMRGAVEGNVGIHPHQALVIINLGGATGAQIIAFARKVQAAVHDKFGVEIDTEVNIV